jgi:hypothetical protein
LDGAAAARFYTGLLRGRVGFEANVVDAYFFSNMMKAATSRASPSFNGRPE